MDVGVPAAVGIGMGTLVAVGVTVTVHVYVGVTDPLPGLDAPLPVSLPAPVCCEFRLPIGLGAGSPCRWLLLLPPHAANVILTVITTNSSTRNVPTLLPFFLLPKNSAAIPNGPTIAPVGYHGT